MKFSSGSFSRTKIVSPTAARSVRPAFFAKGISGFSMTCWLEARRLKTRAMGIAKKAVFLDIVTLRYDDGEHKRDVILNEVKNLVLQPQ